MYAYFIDVSQGSVDMHLWCDGICNHHIIANCLQSLPVKEFRKSVINWQMDGIVAFFHETANFKTVEMNS